MIGKLFYIIGPSGAGKDTLIQYVRTHLSQTTPMCIAHRYITRDYKSEGENHIELSEEEFNLRATNGLFTFHWEGHSTMYGIGKEIEIWMNSGIHVMMNGSRAYLNQAREKIPDLIPIYISVSKQTLMNRLITRGRESKDEIEQRLNRGQQFVPQAPNLIILQNDGPIEECGQALIKAVFSKLV